MRLGLIARADNSGLGVQSWEFFRHMRPERVLVIDVGHLHNDTTHTNKATYLDRYPGATVVKGWMPERLTLRSFLSGLSTVFSVETFYSPEVAQLAHRYGVKTVLQCNPEFLNRRESPDLWVPPTRWMWDTIPKNKTLLPVPIATDRFAAPADFPTAGSANHFLHVVGRPAHLDRNGTADLLKALAFVESAVTVTVRCQQPGYVSGLIREHNIRTPDNVVLRIDSADVENYWDNYAEGDVLVMPRRFGGLCLPQQEALGAGMPVIMPDLSPQNDVLPKEWLVPAAKRGSFMCKQAVRYYSVEPRLLAAAMDRFASDADLYARAKQDALKLRDEYSWTALKPRYEEVLGNV